MTNDFISSQLGQQEKSQVVDGRSWRRERLKLTNTSGYLNGGFSKKINSQQR